MKTPLTLAVGKTGKTGNNGDVHARKELTNSPVIPPADGKDANRAYIKATLTSQYNTEWLQIQAGRNAAWLEKRDLAFDAHAGMAILKEADVLLLGRSSYKKLIEDVSGIVDFPRRTVIEASGYTGNHFCMPDGDTFSPPNEEAPLRVFRPNGSRVRAQGNYVAARRIASLFSGQMIPEFAMGAGLASALLQDSPIHGNIGFDLYGASSSGKTSIQRLVASMVGPVAGREGRYMQSLNTTATGLQELMPYYNDLPLILDELGLLTSAGSQAAQRNVHESVMRLSDGVPRRRGGSAVGKGTIYRTIYLTSSNRDLRDLLRGLPKHELDAVLVRLIQIPIPRRPEGVFDSVPEGFSDIPSFLGHLSVQMEQNYGTIMRQFLRRLVTYRSNDIPGFREQIRRRIDEFLRLCGAIGGKGTDVRVAMGFGLVMVAGEFGKDFRALPSNFDPQASALACYELHQGSIRRTQSLVERLGEILHTNEVFDVRNGELPSLSDLEMEARGIFIANSLGRRTEIWLSEGRFRFFFVDRAAVLNSEEARRIMITEKKGKQGTFKVYRSARRGHANERVFCFVVPGDIY